jgi:hypothetical protein
MAETRWTPGPWRVDADDEGDPRCVVTDPADPDNEPQIQVAECWDENDAAIIAAATALYRELDHLVALLGPMEQSGALRVPGLATLNGARAALARARGEK